MSSVGISTRFIDGGGLPGFYAFLEALEDPKHHDHDELTGSYGGPFDPNALDEAKIRKRLVRLGPRKTRKPV